MANNTVDILLLGKVERIITPTVTDMTGTTEWLVGLHRSTEVINQVFLAKFLLGLGINPFLVPVLGVLYLLGSFGMAFQTGLGYFRTGFEILVQFLELGMVCRGL